MDGSEPEVVLHSPLALDVCEQRLKDRTVRPSFGSWIEAAGGGPDFHGKVGSTNVRLRRPAASNRTVMELVATLAPAEDGGTRLLGNFRSTFGWPTFRSGSDVDYLLESLHRVARFSSHLPEPSA
jgi:hypothetical protein